ncbi:MAG: hypothetical protein HFH14_02300 [Lachnospiraceae bacterium]|nr:hypothetical protein [Lachnospiraceae bacterium]
MILLTEVTGSIFTGFMTYLMKLVMFAAVAAIGVAVGIRIRKKKNISESEASDDK